MYASAFLTTICVGSNSLSFMVKLSKFSIKSIPQGQTLQKLTGDKQNEMLYQFHQTEQINKIK